MKKIFIFLGVILLLTGCGKSNNKNIIKKLDKQLNSCKSYHLIATLDIYRNEEKYSYDVQSSYMKGDYFKVELVNKNNNHKQIILKNKDGVYVLTPSLNKSFKFQSDWPYNNSQIYLLQPVINDITKDSESNIKNTQDGYIITSKVNYSTEKDFKMQKVYVTKDNTIKKVEVIDSSNTVKMSLNIVDIDFKKTFEDDYFDVNKYKTSEENDTNTKDLEKSDNAQNNNTQNKDTNNEETRKEDSTTSKIDEIIYPMYVPVDTYLSSQDVVSTNSGERVILTFNGESSFTIVQETVGDASSTNYVYGDPYLILDTVGSITDYSVSWISNGVEYSVMSDSMNVDELLTVAQSISVKTVGK